MIERDNPEENKDSSWWLNHISEYAHKWEFGTAEHSAVSDFLALQNLYSHIDHKPPSALNEVSGVDNLYADDWKIFTLQRIALLEHTINQNRSRVPGYSGAYIEISLSFENLIGHARKEASELFSEEDKVKKYMDNLYGEAIDYVAGSVFEKQNPR